MWSPMRAVCALIFAAGALLSPEVTAAQCPDAEQRSGDIGITRIACEDCRIASPTSSTPWRFASEPSITGIAAGSPAAGKLEEGDVIVAVNGAPITSQAGARAFGRLHPTQPVALTIRRDGATHEFLITPNAVCAAADLPGMDAGAQRVSSTRVAVRPRSVTPTDERPAQAARVRAEEAQVRAAAPVRGGASLRDGMSVAAAAPVRSRSWVGIAFSCSDCGIVVEEGTPRWSFGTPPEVYSVETGSPAYAAGIRRGDVLTHVDNLSITSTQGGRRWSSLEPGSVVRVRYNRKTTGAAVQQRTARIQVTASRAAAVSAAAEASAAELRALEATLARQDTTATGLLRNYDEVLRRQHAEQERLIEAVQNGLSSRDEDRRRQAVSVLQEVASRHEQLRAEQLELRRRSSELQESEQERTEHSRRVLEELQLKVAPVQTPTVHPAVRPADQRLRYSGTLRGAEIEVRGINPVTVTERGSELIITTHDTTIIVRVPDRK